MRIFSGWLIFMALFLLPIIYVVASYSFAIKNTFVPAGVIEIFPYLFGGIALSWAVVRRVIGKA